MIRTETTLVCDISGEEGAVTRTFAIDGQTYEIELSERHSKQLDADLAPYLAAARRADRSPVKRRTTADRQHAADIRAWAKAEGIAISDRGRLPGEVVAAYAAREAADAAREPVTA